MRDKGTLEPKLALTEQGNPLSEDIDVKTSLEIVEIINHEDQNVAQAVFEARASIATAIDWVAESFWKGGRLFYVGAGTSGRLGVLDASECPPTFGVPPDQVQALIAGGKKALTTSVEGAEDDAEAGARDILTKKITKKDTVIGISAGATAAYVQGALSAAKKKGCKTAIITCTPLADRGNFADLLIAMLTGPEIITGSTRMKAGTATKMALNMISTGAMIRTGRTYGNLMVDLSCSNRKLVKRGHRIIQSVTRLSETSAATLLRAAKGHVKTALAMGTLDIPRDKAEKLLKDNHGFLRRLFSWPHQKNTKIEAIFFDMDGTILQYALPTGFSTWAALGWAFGIYEHMEKWVDEYLAGRMSYGGIWEACANEIKGRGFGEIRDVLFPCAGTPPYSRGFQDCARVLREHYKIGIVSSGITLVSEEIKKKLGLEFELSNSLGTNQGVFDGTYRVGVPFDSKLDAVRGKAAEMGIPLSKVCFIGDSPNDIDTLMAVGLPVAYSPKTQSVVDAAQGNVIGDFLQLPRLIERF
jgi:N-acetylmuramic acid 6-phosphate etherase